MSRTRLTPPPPVLSVGAVEVVEGDAGQSAAQVTFTLSRPADAAGHRGVHHRGRYGDRRLRLRGELRPGVLPGRHDSVVAVAPVNGDTVDEPNETFSVTASAPAGATLGDADRRRDDRRRRRTPAAAAARAVHRERHRDRGQHRHEGRVRDGQARPGPDQRGHREVRDVQRDGQGELRLRSSSGTVRFAAGVRTATITLSIRNDKVREPKENYNVTLSAPSGATMADPAAVMTIGDND